MGPTGHFVSSILGAGVIYNIFGNFISAIVFFVPAVFIDLDHIYDYVRQYGIRGMNLKTFCEICSEHKITNVSIVLHSFELLLILWIFITINKLNMFWVALALGISIHLILDQFSNGAFALTYFFTYRWIKNFKTEKLFRNRI